MLLSRRESKEKSVYKKKVPGRYQNGEVRKYLNAELDLLTSERAAQLQQRVEC